LDGQFRVQSDVLLVVLVDAWRFVQRLALVRIELLLNGRFRVPEFGSPENWALQNSQIPSTATFLTRFTIRRWRFGMKQVSHRPWRLLPCGFQTAPLRKLFHIDAQPRLGTMAAVLEVGRELPADSKLGATYQ